MTTENAPERRDRRKDHPGKAENLTAPKFKKGESGNPGGTPSEVLKAHRESAKLAARAQLKGLEALNKVIDEAAESEDFAAIMDTVHSKLALIKEGHDRELGRPMQRTDVTSDGEKVQQNTGFVLWDDKSRPADVSTDDLIFGAVPNRPTDSS